jgi:hypothetical protein
MYCETAVLAPMMMLLLSASELPMGTVAGFPLSVMVTEKFGVEK